MENQEYKKMVLHLDAGFAGMDATEFWKIPVNISENDLSNLAWECACNHAEMYGIYPENCRPDDLDEEDDGGDSYSDNIEGYFEDYDPEKHDGLRVGADESWRKY